MFPLGDASRRPNRENGASEDKIWRVGWQSWLALFGLGLALWLATTYFELILEIGAVLFGAYLLSLAIRPIADELERWRVPRAITILPVVCLTFLSWSSWLTF